MNYKKLYTQNIDFPYTIPYKGITEDSSLASDYYILLEKNYLPVESTISYNITGTNEQPTWLTLDIIPENEVFNKLIVKSAEANSSTAARDCLISFNATNLENNISPCNSLTCYFL